MTDSGDWRYVYASVNGVAHLADGSDCQDACAVERLSVPEIGPVLTLAVADGAGSATHSRAGAELACRTLLTECATRLPTLAATDWTPALAGTLFQDIRAALVQHAANKGLPLRELACTLLGAVVADDQALFLQIGDGAIVIDTGEGYRPVFWPQTGEYANETRFVTDSDAAARLECVALAESVAEIALLTDGLQLLALHYQNRQAHAPFFRPLFQRLRAHPEPGCPATLTTALERFLASPAVNHRTHDDKTLILATRLPAVDMESPSAPSEATATTSADTADTPDTAAQSTDISSVPETASPAAHSALASTEAGSSRPDPATSTSPVQEHHGDEAV